MRNYLRIALTGLALASAPAGAWAAGLIAGPFVRYDVAGEATVCWQTEVAGPSVVVVNGKGMTGKRFEDPRAAQRHSLPVGPLAGDSAYRYEVFVSNGGKAESAGTYGFDTSFNYAGASLAGKEVDFGGLAPEAPAEARRILETARIDRGFCVVSGAGSGRLAWELARNSRLTVIALETDAAKVTEARERLRRAGAYGQRITIRQVESLAATGLPSCFANLVVSEAALTEGRLPGARECMRILRPAGGTLCVGGQKVSPERLAGWLKEGGMSGQDGTFVRGGLPGAGVWSHQYGTAANAGYGGEHLAGAGRTDQMRLAWLGAPGADFGLDRQVRMPAPLSVGGRVYHQGDAKLMCLDAYNGTVLWLMEVPRLWRINVPRDTSNLCADEEGVYVAVGETVMGIDGATGAMRRTYAMPETAGGYDWGYVAREGAMLLGGRVRKGAFYTGLWGRGNWYDDAGGGGSHKVCSDMLFGLDAKTGKTAWTWKSGVVINSTIAAADGRVYFVESRNPGVKAAGGGRVGDKNLWQDRFLVAIDAVNGHKVWETNVTATPPGGVVYYGLYAGGLVLLAGSDRGRYNINTYDAATGAARWGVSHGWPGAGHGGHMQRPVATDKLVFMRPNSYELKTGKLAGRNIGGASCGTYAGTADGLLFRGGGECAMWDARTGKMTTWNWLRPSCWVSMIAAGGMVLAPEGGGGCNCGRWLETSAGFLPATVAEGGK